MSLKKMLTIRDAKIVISLSELCHLDVAFSAKHSAINNVWFNLTEKLPFHFYHKYFHRSNPFLGFVKNANHVQSVHKLLEMIFCFVVYASLIPIFNVVE